MTTTKTLTPLKMTLPVLAALAATKFIVHIATAGHGAYGYFRDEFYYLDCAANLAWGYVDHPPFSIAVLAIVRALFGPSLYAIRLPVILAGMAAVVLTGLIAREMGGGRFAQFLAALSALTAPVCLTMSSFYSMNAFDIVFWSIAALLLVRIINTGNATLWLWFGLVAGMGLENKYSMGFFGGAVTVALLMTPERRFFATWQLWVGGLIAGLLIIPHVIWEAANDWPTREFMQNAALYKNLPTTLTKFLLGQLLVMSPAGALVWVPGVLAGFMTVRGKRYRIFSIAYVVLILVFWRTNGKSYYLAPMYPTVMALGAIWWEGVCVSRRWIRPVIPSLLIVFSMLLSPYALPLLAPDSFLSYQRALGIKAPQQAVAHAGPLPQRIWEWLGWEELVAFLAAHYNALPAADKAQCALFVSNYGEAGAVNLFGPRYGLPHAISGYMNNYLWGPRGASGDVMLVYWNDIETLNMLFSDVQEIGRFEQPFVMDRQNHRPLYLCRHLRKPMVEAWPAFKLYR